MCTRLGCRLQQYLRLEIASNWRQGLPFRRLGIVRLAGRLATREHRPHGAHHPECPEEGTDEGQWPGEESGETQTDKGDPQQGGAGRRSESVLVRAQGCAALLERGAAHPDDGGRRARAAAYDASARPSV